MSIEPVSSERSASPPARVEPSAAPRALDRCSAAVAEVGEVRSGRPEPLGAWATPDGVNFALFSRNATRVRLELFDSAMDNTPSRIIDLDPQRHRTGDIWHAWVRGVRNGAFYGYRVDGPYRPEDGHRFNVNKLLLDPYAAAVASSSGWDLAPARGYDPHAPEPDLAPSLLDDAGAMPKCVFVHDHFDWHADRSPRTAWSNTVIYETHVRGLTIHPSSGVAHPGTYRGLIEKIPYLRDLGVTAVELMPIFEFDEDQGSRVDPRTGKPLGNYWGYEPIAFFAPKASYCSSGNLGRQKLEFKQMVEALHAAGLEVILDVVFNHTAEGNRLGPTLSFRGIDNSIYYMLADDKRYYRDFTGTGNTVNANHPVVRDLVLDALRYWVLEMRVDGFRFDLAAVLGRDEEGNLLANPPLLERIAEDPLLRDVKLIAEAWDAAGAYEVGSFSERRWAEWNDRFRDDVRRFWRGDDGMLGAFASRLAGSADVYGRSGKGPECSINLVTCHDGFTLNDLVTYRNKHNEANGENNRDGTPYNWSHNYGAEGPAPGAIDALRRRQIKNFLLTLFVARGVPMLMGGDEWRRTQNGNNNAYCHDDATSWYDWDLLRKHRDIYGFTRLMIALRKAHPVLSRERYYTDREIHWFGPEGHTPHWADPRAKQLGCLITEDASAALCLVFNAAEEPASFRLPAARSSAGWRLVVDTSRETVRDSVVFEENVSKAFVAAPRTSAVLLS